MSLGGMTPAAIERETGIDIRYVDDLFGLRCAPDLLALGVFPNLKELTEQFAAYHAVQNHLSNYALGDPSIVCLCVGDGTTPRAAALFAFRTAWQCYSVDPNMGMGWANGETGAKRIKGGVQRVHALRCKVENFRVTAKRAIVVAVHSHANLEESVRAIDGAEHIGVVAIQCCKPLALPTPPDFDYRDNGILSPHNNVKVWRDVAVPS